MRQSLQRATGLAGVLRGVVADMQSASGADIVSIFLYEESSRRYYAPFAAGQPQESLLDSLADMTEQLGRYADDASHGKVPDDLGVHNYGSTVWITVTRRPLIARDAPSQIDSTFIRRYQVQATIGLPINSGERLLGLVYLNYRERDKVPDDARVAELERMASTAGEAVEAALAAASRAALNGLGRLTSFLSEPAGRKQADMKELRRVLSIALADLLLASELDAAAIYQFAPHRTSLELVTAHAPVAAPVRVERGNHETWEAALSTAVAQVTGPSDLHPVAVSALGSISEPHGYLVVLSRDKLATVRRAPATDVLLRAGAELIGGALANQRLIDNLAEGEGQPDESMFVRLAAGAATTAAIEASVTGAGTHAAKRVPRWALEEDRPLAADDVLVYVARTWRSVIVGPLEPKGGSRSDVVSGPILGAATWVEVPVVREHGGEIATVSACLLGESDADRDRDTSKPPFTLAGEVFEKSGHADLIRIFLPFGSDQHSRASGVLEVGYHRSYERRPDWGQIEALRAAAGQVASAVETARLYEEARRHAEQLELSADVSRAIASSIDLDQTLTLVAHNLARLVDASTCQIALYEEDQEGWYGAAASDQEDLWRRQRAERTEPSFLFDLLEKPEPLVIEDAGANDRVPHAYVKTFGVRSLLALPLIADGQPIGAAILAERERMHVYTPEEVQRAQGLALQAAVAIKNARLHALAEEERHLQKDFVLI